MPFLGLDVAGWDESTDMIDVTQVKDLLPLHLVIPDCGDGPLTVAM